MMGLPTYNLKLNQADLVEQSIEMFRLAAKMSQKYYQKHLLICYSGGKDSDVLLGLAKMAGIEYEVQHSVTTADSPDTMLHIKKVFSRLKANGVRCFYNYPKYKGKRCSMWSIIPQKLMPPTRIVRYCCAILKEPGGEGRAIATGVRRSESVRRRNREYVNNFSKSRPAKLNFKDAASLFEDAENFIEHDDNFTRSCKIKGETSFQPIIEWDTDNIWQFITDNNIEVNPMYSVGFKRVGCIGCPSATIREREREFEMYPKYKDAYMRAFNRMLNHRKEKGLQMTWQTADEVMDWWLRQ